MKNLYTENNKIVFNNVIYTIDMLRLRADFTVEDFSKIEFYIKTVWKDYDVTFYRSTSISSFQNNYVIKLSENCSFWLGFLHNTELHSNKSLSNEKNKYNFTIEFNPNKISFKRLDYILNFTNKWVINSIDIAMDIPVSILDLFCFDKKRKRSMRIFNNGYDDKTIYIGKSDNRIKIYNKKIESNLDRELTRVEISSKINLPIQEINYYVYSIELPEIYLNQYVYSFSDEERRKKKDIMYCILYALQEGYDINDLSRKYKDKVKRLIEGGYKIVFSNECCTNVLRLLINTIFGKRCILSE